MHSWQTASSSPGKKRAQRTQRIAAGGDDDLPPLLGVPFTVKESIALAGMPQATGLLVRDAITAQPRRRPRCSGSSMPARLRSASPTLRS